MDLEYNKDTCYDILSLYGNKLPFVVSEYFCRLFNSKILCKTPLRYKTIFEPFKDYKEGITYEFLIVKSNNGEYDFIRLVSVIILIKANQEEVFMHKYSNYVHSTSSDNLIEWSDEDETPDGFVGKCTISF